MENIAYEKKARERGRVAGWRGSAAEEAMRLSVNVTLPLFSRCRGNWHCGRGHASHVRSLLHATHAVATTGTSLFPLSHGARDTRRTGDNENMLTS